MKKSYAIFLLLALSLTTVSVAEEGMWLYNAVPKDKLKALYGFVPTQSWLDHMRLSSVKFPGGSGSFVSANGLLMTNHHIGAGCINALSSTTKDYMKTGFYAATQADEVFGNHTDLLSTKILTRAPSLISSPSRSDISCDSRSNEIA